MTRKGYEALAAEFNQLRNEERPQVVQGIATAAAEGDRSENAEYIYGKKRLRELDKRLRYLSGVLKDVQVIDPETLSGDKVCFGATVVLLDEQRNKKTYQIVGVGEADADKGTISRESVMAKALVGKSVGDVVFVSRPAGDAEFEIVDLIFC